VIDEMKNLTDNAQKKGVDLRKIDEKVNEEGREDKPARQLL